MKTLPLTAGQRDLKRYGQELIAIRRAQQDVKVTTAEYYDRLMKAGSTAERNQLNAEHINRNKGVLPALREQWTNTLEKWREAAKSASIPQAATE